MEENDRLNTEKLTAQINTERGVSGKWPASFDYKIDPNRITLETNRKIYKSGYRCLDSWGIAILDYAKTVLKSNIDRLSFVINKNGNTWTPNAEAFKRRASYLNMNIDEIDIDVEYNHENISLYTKNALFNRPNNEIIRDYLKDRGDDDKGDLLEKAFQAFLFGKDLGTEVRTNDRLAILGEHFYKLKKKQYGVLREFPTGAFDNKISNTSRITPTEFVDIVTLNRWGYLSVIELKLDDPKLEVMAQILDYALYFACYRKKLLKVIEKNPAIVPAKPGIMCYVVNNRYHARFMDIYKYYSAKNKNYPFRIFKVVLGDTVE